MLLTSGLGSITLLAGPAYAEIGCQELNHNTVSSYFDGYDDFLSNSPDGSNYRGVKGNISTRIGFACDGTSTDAKDPTINFTTAWVMLAAHNPQTPGCGYSQGGYNRGNASAITTFAETNNNYCTNQRDYFPAVIQPGTTYTYNVDYEVGCHCAAVYGPSGFILATNYDPLNAGNAATYWTSNFAQEMFGETKDTGSDMPGHFGTSAFFSQLKSKTVNNGNYVSGVGATDSSNDNPARWAHGSINEFPPLTYGENFQIYTY